MVSSKIARTIGRARRAFRSSAARRGGSSNSASSPSLPPCRDRLLCLLVELTRQVATAIEDAIDHDGGLGDVKCDGHAMLEAGDP